MKDTAYLLKRRKEKDVNAKPTIAGIALWESNAKIWVKAGYARDEARIYEPVPLLWAKGSQSPGSPVAGSYTAQIATLETCVDGDLRVEIAAWANGLVGAARVELADTERPRLVDVFVKDAYRRKGIAKAMAKVAMKWARDEGKPLYLYVSPQNEAARQLYEQLGWTYLEQDADGDLWMQAPGAV